MSTSENTVHTECRFLVYLSIHLNRLNLAIHMANKITLKLRENWPIFQNDVPEHRYLRFYIHIKSFINFLNASITSSLSTYVINVYLFYQKKWKPNNNKSLRIPITLSVNESLHCCGVSSCYTPRTCFRFFSKKVNVLILFLSYWIKGHPA